MAVKKVDTNEDGVVDKAEVEAMAHGFETKLGLLEARVDKLESVLSLRLKRLD